MVKVFVKQLAVSVVLMVLVSFFVFILIDVAPGDAAEQLAGETATPERIEEVREELGLNDPLPVRYARWVGDAVTGDLGESLTTGESVRKAIVRALPPTISLMVVTFAMSLTGALILGTLAALRPGSRLDRTTSVIAALGVAVPGFWIAMVLASEFAVKRSWFPAIGYSSPGDGLWEWLKHLVIPAIALSTLIGAELMRQLRGSLQDALRTDYVLAARAKGIRANKLVFKHAMKNAAVPVITVAGVRFAQLLGGTVILEQIFNLQGLGQATIRAVLARDIPMVLGVTVFSTLVVVVTNLVIEMIHPYFNPKVRS